MFYKVEIPNIVHLDIESFADYIYRFSFDKNASKKVYDELYASIFSLDFLPYRFETYFGEYRRFIVSGNYKIIYRIDEENKKVIIIRIFRVETNTNI